MLTSIDQARSLLKRGGVPAEWRSVLPLLPEPAHMLIFGVVAIVSRKELQHMLFSRRKAEIEVLSVIRSVTDCTADLPPNRQARFGESSNSGIPLLRYLVAKISAACVEASSATP